MRQHRQLRVAILAVCVLAPAVRLESQQAQLALRPATVQLVAQLPPTVGVSWTLQALKLPQVENAIANVLVLRSSWVLAKGHAASYECRLEESSPGTSQLIALQRASDPQPLFRPAGMFASPALTHLSLLQAFVPQRGQHHQDDGLLVLNETSAAAEQTTIHIRVVVI